ncbi:hypothetical protein [Methylomonas sp. AM2-LC]|uniref:hypothetical protein n=1 Tax=Methylomonas sp. AM2-LC TaxID=3153301 RepID=UPI003263B39A
MIELSPSTEHRLILAAQAVGQNLSTFLDSLLDEYLEDQFDIKLAETALKEDGGMSLKDFRSKHGV